MIEPNGHDTTSLVAVTAGAYERLRILTTYRTIAMVGLSAFCRPLFRIVRLPGRAPALKQMPGARPGIHEFVRCGRRYSAAAAGMTMSPGFFGRSRT